MLSSIRKFSGSIYAKVLLVIVIIPFVFWGMGDFGSGNKNVIVVIDKEKYTINDFNDFIQKNASSKIKANQIDEFLGNFIGNKLIEKEIKHFDIKLSERSLSNLIKSQKQFKRNNEFSRTEYEKFLLERNITAVNFEYLLTKQEKERQLFDIIGGGIYPPKFIIKNSYERINSKRKIQVIDLNKILEGKIKFSEDEIKSHFEKNKGNYLRIYRTIELLELSPKKLVDSDQFSDIFFKKIDEIEDSIIIGNQLNDIILKFSLDKPQILNIDEKGLDENNEKHTALSEKLIKIIFNIDELDPLNLVEDNNKYFIINLVKTESIQKNYDNEIVKNDIINDLLRSHKIKFISDIVSKINKNNFNKKDFDKLASDNKIQVKKIYLEGQNDADEIDSAMVKEIYKFQEKKVFIINDLNLVQNFMVYIDKIDNATVDENSDDYKKYKDLSKIQIVSELYNTYDRYLKKKYKIDINHQAVDAVKSYFN